VEKSLKEWREHRQLTQQELANKSGISIRTIQRIEKNISAGSPYVIKALCNALQIEVAHLELNGLKSESAEHSYEQEAPLIKTDHDDTTLKKLKLINFSPIFILFLPFLNILLPALFFLKYKGSLLDKSEALKIISFQILWTVGLFVIVLFIPAIVRAFWGLTEFTGFVLPCWLYFGCILFNLSVIFNTSIRLNNATRILPFIPNIL